MKNLLLLICLTMVSGSLASSQYWVKGKVTNNAGNPLHGAVVRVGEISVTTSESGVYHAEPFAAGTARVQVSFVGYETFTSNITITGNMVIDVNLDEKAVLGPEVTILAIRARSTDPVAFSELTYEDIEKKNFGQDIPYLLSLTPSMVVTSDAGTGIGYTGLRLRGTDITRVNVTVNGIPLNDSESQGVFWVNMPDFATSVDRVQIQRGVGTSTNGAASFGGSINFSTIAAPGDKAHVVIDNGFGSFNTMRNSVQLYTGLLPNRFAFNARLSNITSDGFIDRAFADLKSFYFSAGYFGNASSLRFITFSGKEQTYQAWYGVPLVKLHNDRAGMEKLIAMDGWSEAEANNLFNSNQRTFNRYLYDNQTDNYQQDHFQLHYSYQPTSKLLVNSALHYTRGKGFYESFKYNQSFASYNFPFSTLNINGEDIDNTDLIAQKWLDNHFYGITFSAAYQHENMHVVIGGAANQYDGDHFGNVTWTAVNAGLPANFQWYFNQGTKRDLNYFAKITSELLPSTSIYLDLQGRHVYYSINGLHDDQRDLTRSTRYDFFNPKFGINYEFEAGKRLYASVAVAHREPSRSDFRDADLNMVPRPERLVNYEAGFDWITSNWGLQANLFYMGYRDQLVLTGRINDVGAYIMNNVPESYRAGIELSGRVRVTPNLSWSGNIAISRNMIKNFTEYVDNWDTGLQESFFLGDTDIAFSPRVVASSSIEANPLANLSVILNSRHVGRQYIDNTSNQSRMLDSYLVNDLVTRYRINLKGNTAIELALQVNNLLDASYISNAWVYSYISGQTRDVIDGYFPQAGRHLMAQVRLKF